LSGESRVRITNAIKFHNEIVKNRPAFYANDVKEWIFSDIIAILRDRIQKMEATETTSESLSIAVQAKGEQDLPRYGLKIEKINVMYTAFPEDWVKARRQIGISSAEAQATKVRGHADAEALRAKMDVLKDSMRVAGETGTGVELESTGTIRITQRRKGDDELKFCPSCGAKLEVVTKFCPKCGSKL